jgi:hypothetical protein
MENVNIAQALASMTPEERARVLAEAGIRTGGLGHPSLKVSEKGGIQFRSVPGASIKFGLTLFAETVVWLYDNREEVEAFMRKNAGSLSFKGERGAAVKARLTR